MSPVKADENERERGRRLEAWLEAVRPLLVKTKRGPDVFGVSRPTVRNWIMGADINNAAIARILEVGGCDAVAWILGATPAKRGGRRQVAQAMKILKSRGKNSQ